MAGTAMFGGSLVGCASGSDSSNDELALGFAAVPKSLADARLVPAGYTRQHALRAGRPADAAAPDYANNGTDTGASFAAAPGDHHDGMDYFGLGADGTPDANASTAACSCINHENITQIFLHMAGRTVVAGVRTVADEGDQGNQCPRRVGDRGGADQWQRSAACTASAFNRRITPTTPMDISGPAPATRLLTHPNLADWHQHPRHHQQLRHRLHALGHLPDLRGELGRLLHARRGRRRHARRRQERGRRSSATASRRAPPAATAGRPAVGEPADRPSARWNATQPAPRADGSDDFRNEPNTFGYVVEIDPFDPTSMPRKRTALGRFAHESAASARVAAGKPARLLHGRRLARRVHLQVRLHRDLGSPPTPTGGLAAGDKYLDAGTLYVAKFNADGTRHLDRADARPTPRSPATPPTPSPTRPTCWSTRASRPTRWARRRWTARSGARCNPTNGEVYFTLTNNSNRKLSPARGQCASMRPTRAPTATPMPAAHGAPGNTNGHIIRMDEAGGDGAATTSPGTSTCSAPQSDADAANVNLSGLTADQRLLQPRRPVVQPRHRPVLDPDRRRRLHRRHQLHDAGGDSRAGRRRRRGHVANTIGAARR